MKAARHIAERIATCATDLADLAAGACAQLDALRDENETLRRDLTRARAELAQHAALDALRDAVSPHLDALALPEGGALSAEAGLVGGSPAVRVALTHRAPHLHSSARVCVTIRNVCEAPALLASMVRQARELLGVAP